MKGLVACMLCLTLLPINAAAQEKSSLKRKVIDIPVGEFVEIRTRDKLKIRGRIGAATDEGVAVETIRGGKPETEQVEFARMKSIKVTSPAERLTGSKVAAHTGKVVLGILAVMGVVVLIAGVVIGRR